MIVTTTTSPETGEPLTPVEQARPAAGREAAPVDPHEHGPPGVVDSGRPDVEAQTVLGRIGRISPDAHARHGRGLRGDGPEMLRLPDARPRRTAARAGAIFGALKDRQRTGHPGTPIRPRPRPLGRRLRRYGSSRPHGPPRPGRDPDIPEPLGSGPEHDPGSDVSIRAQIGLRRPGTVEVPHVAVKRFGTQTRRQTCR